MIRLYLDTYVLLAISLPAWIGVRWALRRLHAPISSKHELFLAQIMFAGSLLAPVAVAWIPSQALFTPSVEVWDASRLSWSQGAPAASRKALLIASSVGLPRASVEVTRRTISFVVWAVIIAIVVRLSLLAARLRSVARTLSQLPAIRTVGGVRVAVSDDYPVPFSTRVYGRAFVVIPASFVSNPRDYRIAVHHELQHHRQRDPMWAVGMETVRALFPWHPALRAWARRLEQQQEFACDEAVVGRGPLSADDYCRCLLRAAQSAMHSSRGVIGATTMASAAHNHILRKRIEMILNHQQHTTRTSTWVVAGVTACAIAAMLSTAYASKSAIQDRTVGRDQVEALISRATLRGATISLPLNDRVVARVNDFVGTPDGRAWMKASLARMRQYEPMVRGKLLQYGLPEEFLAVPLLESGYRNDLIAPRTNAAGIWQFIPATARRYNLTVDAGQDDRLDPEKQTDAAMHMLTVLYITFNDWGLALKAYNEGPAAVRLAIDTYGTRDPWELERNDSKEDYLAGAVAAMIVYRYPELVD